MTLTSGFAFGGKKQDRISLWHEQSNRYASELRELKQQMVAQLENLDKEKETLRANLDGVGARVDRVEREMDYMETQNGAQPCVDVDDKLVEQQVNQVKEKNKAKYAKLSGEATTGRTGRSCWIHSGDKAMHMIVLCGQVFL